MFCFVLTSLPLMLRVYLQTFEAALFLEEETQLIAATYDWTYILGK